MWNPESVLLTNFTLKIVKVGGSEEESDSLITERIGLVEASSMF